MDKQWLTYEQQLTLLAERGLIIPNKPAAQIFLSRVSYYRLPAIAATGNATQLMAIMHLSRVHLLTQ